MSPSLSLVYSTLFSLLLCSSYGGQAHGELHDFGVVSVDSLTPATVCSPWKAPGQNSLKVVHRHGPCSPYPGSKPNHLQILARDSVRVASLQASEVSLPAWSGIPVDNFNYVVDLGFGTPKKEQIVVFDTGSNLCWLQCNKQEHPAFDHTASYTYSKVPYNSLICSNLNYRINSHGSCAYKIEYRDKSITTGFVATDTLMLSSTIIFPRFVFGCAMQNQGHFGKVSGLVGLGRNSYSLFSQTASSLGNVFSYCLPSTSSSTGHLTLGSSLSPPTVYTPMLTNTRRPGQYFIDLIGISVDGVRLSISPTVFQTVGTIIDSGTVITHLPPLAYHELRRAFRRAMFQYPLVHSFGILDTCYDFSKVEKVSNPPITLHYSSADVELRFPGVFYIHTCTQVCLAFAGNANPHSMGIVGNVQQRTFEVIYDIGAKKIGFAPGACT